MAKFSISTAESEQRQSVLELARTLEAITAEKPLRPGGQQLCQFF